LTLSLNVLCRSISSCSGKQLSVNLLTLYNNDRGFPLTRLFFAAAQINGQALEAAGAWWQRRKWHSRGQAGVSGMV
jgi:hypothetical protein